MRFGASRRYIAALLALSLAAAACADDDPLTTATPEVGAEAGSAGSDDADHKADMADAEHDANENDHDDESADSAASGDAETDDAHSHDGLREWDGGAAPTIDVEVVADPGGGIDVRVATTNYTVNAAAASTEHVPGQGHFHLWIDGEKVLRFYNDAIHFEGVTEGDIEVQVELSANDHQSYGLEGAVLADAVMFTVPSHEHDDHSHGDPEPQEVEGDIPVLGIDVVADPKSGYNAFIDVEGLTLSAQNATADHVVGEGHLHLYVNGQKVARLYGTATHLPVLPAGDVEISVVAYTNDHRPYVVDGDEVSATVGIVVPKGGS